MTAHKQAQKAPAWKNLRIQMRKKQWGKRGDEVWRPRRMVYALPNRTQGWELKHHLCSQGFHHPEYVSEYIHPLVIAELEGEMALSTS